MSDSNEPTFYLRDDLPQRLRHLGVRDEELYLYGIGAAPDGEDDEGELLEDEEADADSEAYAEWDDDDAEEDEEDDGDEQERLHVLREEMRELAASLNMVDTDDASDALLHEAERLARREGHNLAFLARRDPAAHNRYMLEASKRTGYRGAEVSRY